MPLKRCVVSFVDLRGCRHSTEVFAASVLEAAALGVRTVREQSVTTEEGEFQIKVEIQTTTVHEVTYSALQKWLSSNSKNPKEQALKARLR